MPLTFTPPSRARRSAWPLMLLLGALAAGHPAAQAADGADKRVAAAREAARKAQAAQQQAEQERDRLRQEQAGLNSRQTQLERELGGSRAQVRSAQTALAQVQAERDRLRDELARLKSEQQQLADRESQAQQALAAQRQLTQTLTGLLERSVAALGRAEQANRELHGLGLKAVEAYTQRTPDAWLARSEPFMGLGAVTLENEAEALRQALDAQRVVP